MATKSDNGRIAQDEEKTMKEDDDEESHTEDSISCKGSSKHKTSEGPSDDEQEEGRTKWMKGNYVPIPPVEEESTETAPVARTNECVRASNEGKDSPRGAETDRSSGIANQDAELEEGTKTAVLASRARRTSQARHSQKMSASGIQGKTWKHPSPTLSDDGVVDTCGRTFMPPDEDDDVDDDDDEDYGGEHPMAEDHETAVRESRRKAKREEEERCRPPRFLKPPVLNSYRRWSSAAATRMKVEIEECQRRKTEVPSQRVQRFQGPNAFVEERRPTPSRGAQEIMEREHSRVPANREASNASWNRKWLVTPRTEYKVGPFNASLSKRRRAAQRNDESTKTTNAELGCPGNAPARDGHLAVGSQGPRDHSGSHENLMRFLKKRKNYERDLANEAKSHGGWNAVRPKPWIESIKAEDLEMLCKYKWLISQGSLTEKEFQRRLREEMRRRDDLPEPNESDIVVVTNVGCKCTSRLAAVSNGSS
ncbi:Aste57867_1714 [Aphanomyces stellatus]|uniref:Aste57867_1714 protein n=1 Tax=Aphanomyces stellatus TaxID=120398 RepID=A0A485K6X0_9STRA|nr:hypothetical protein As57867_001712 [Aphanomyces stellatus]VFT78925.1 Aste57867_1714 [Aphanomyces stellatus]